MSGILYGVGSLAAQATTLTGPLTMADVRRAYDLILNYITQGEVQAYPQEAVDMLQRYSLFLSDHRAREAERVYRRHGGQKKVWKYSGKHPLDVAAEVER